MSIDWDGYFLHLTEAIAIKSKDRSTKLGAIIVGPDHEPRSFGYNSFPRGLNDDVEERHQRPEKYKYIEHAERNAIYNAAMHGAALKNCILYCQWLPCTDCARAIIQCGITKVVVKSFEIPERWQGDVKTSLIMLKECGVTLQQGSEVPIPIMELFYKKIRSALDYRKVFASVKALLR